MKFCALSTEKGMIVTMKICFLTNNIFSLGGVQRVVSVLANKLCETNQVDIICTHHDLEINRKIYGLNENINIIKDKNISTRILKQRLRSRAIKSINNNFDICKNKIICKEFINSIYPNKFQNKLIEIINQNQYDIVIGVEGEYSLLLANISDKIKSKTIGWQHNSYDAYLENKNKYHWNQKKVFEHMIPKLDEYVVLTEYDRDKFKSKNNINSRVIYNPRSFKSNEKSDLSEKMFLAAGRFVEQKGFDLLVESFNLFSSTNNEWKLTIIGEGKDKEKIKSKVSKYNLNERIFIKEPTDKIKQYFLQSSVLLLPSRWEGMPMIVLESLEMGVPIIAYEISAVNQIIKHGKEGLIIDKYDTYKFANAMSYISSDYKLRKTMGLEAIESSKRFDIERISNEWNELFYKVLQSSE